MGRGNKGGTVSLVDFAADTGASDRLKKAIMATEPNLAERLELLRKAALECGSALVTAILGATNQQGGYKADLGLDEFLNLLRQYRPRIIYLHAEEFDAEKNLLSELSIVDEDGNEPLSKNSQFQTQIKKWAKKNGQISLFLASFIMAGVLHVVWEQPTWIDEFEAQAKELDSSLTEERRRMDDQKKKAERARFGDVARELCKHPRFNAPRWSFEKREYLAKSLFPELDDSEIRIMVEEATNMSWIQG